MTKTARHRIYKRPFGTSENYELQLRLDKLAEQVRKDTEALLRQAIRETKSKPRKK